MMHINLRNDDNYFGVPLPDGNDFHVHSQWEADEEGWCASSSTPTPRSTPHTPRSHAARRQIAQPTSYSSSSSSSSSRQSADCRY